MNINVKMFSNRLDEIFEQGDPTKAQIIDTFIKFSKPIEQSESKSAEEILNYYLDATDLYSLNTPLLLKAIEEYAAQFKHQSNQRVRQQRKCLSPIKTIIKIKDAIKAMEAYASQFKEQPEQLRLSDEIPSEIVTKMQHKFQPITDSAFKEGMYSGYAFGLQDGYKFHKSQAYYDLREELIKFADTYGLAQEKTTTETIINEYLSK